MKIFAPASLKRKLVPTCSATMITCGGALAAADFAALPDGRGIGIAALRICLLSRNRSNCGFSANCCKPGYGPALKESRLLAKVISLEPVPDHSNVPSVYFVFVNNLEGIPSRVSSLAVLNLSSSSS